jgi:Tol biopolymer transport system component
VYIRAMPVGGGEPKVLVYLYGGQGTINTPSWSPDSNRFAFVSNSALLLEGGQKSTDGVTDKSKNRR